VNNVADGSINSTSLKKLLIAPFNSIIANRVIHWNKLMQQHGIDMIRYFIDWYQAISRVKMLYIYMLADVSDKTTWLNRLVSELLGKLGKNRTIFHVLNDGTCED
jgi:hypothetical protein